MLDTIDPTWGIPVAVALWVTYFVARRRLGKAAR
jgi:hypothetical protein